MTPWTVTVTLHWRPTPRAYGAQTSLLTSLEDHKRLRAFQIRDEVGRALVDDNAELAIAVTYFSVAFASDLPEGAVLPSLLDSVLDAVKPRITSLTVRFQHLCSLPSASNSEQARKRAASAILGPLAPPLKIVDSAILFDGIFDDDLTCQTEFGIVDKSEAVARLTQAMGRLESPHEPSFSHVDWKGRNLPEVALYVDSRWRNSKALPTTSSESLYALVLNYHQHANELAKVLLERVSGAQLQ